MSPANSELIAFDANALVQSDARFAELLPFKNLTTNQLQQILSQATVRATKPKQAYFHEGDQADSFYILLDGALRILRTTDEGEQVVMVSQLSEGQLSARPEDAQLAVD